MLQFGVCSTHRSSPPSPEPPSAGESVAVDVVLSDDQVHHPPTRKNTLNLLVPSDLSASPWFNAGDHRSLRAPGSSVGVLNLTGGTPPRQPLFFFPLEPFSESAFRQMCFLLGLALFFRNHFLVFQTSPWFFSVSSQISPWTKTLITF